LGGAETGLFKQAEPMACFFMGLFSDSGVAFKSTGFTVCRADAIVHGGFDGLREPRTVLTA